MLSAISEKDAQIGSLEFDRSADSKEIKMKIQRLNDEKDYLHQQLKELVNLFKFILTYRVYCIYLLVVNKECKTRYFQPKLICLFFRMKSV